MREREINCPRCRGTGIETQKATRAAIVCPICKGWAKVRIADPLEPDQSKNENGE